MKDKNKCHVYAVKKRHSLLKYMGAKCHEKSAYRQAKRYIKKGYYQAYVFYKNRLHRIEEGNIENGKRK